MNTEEASTSAMFVSKRSKPKGHNTRNSIKKDNERKDIKCFKCNQIGHFAKYCKKQTNTHKKNNEESKCAEVAMSAHMSVEKAEPPMTTVMKPVNHWYLDSGTSSHMCHDQLAFKEISEENKLTLNLTTTDSTKIHETGVVKLNISNKTIAVLKDTLFVLNLLSNLLSVTKITDYGHEVTFRKNSATIVNKTN